MQALRNRKFLGRKVGAGQPVSVRCWESTSALCCGIWHADVLLQVNSVTILSGGKPNVQSAAAFKLKSQARSRRLTLVPR